MDYSDFRQSQEIEDRRRQKLQWVPGVFGGSPKGDPNVFDSGDLTGLKLSDFPIVQRTSAGAAIGLDQIERNLLDQEQDAAVRDALDYKGPVSAGPNDDPNGPPARIRPAPTNPVPFMSSPNGEKRLVEPVITIRDTAGQGWDAFPDKPPAPSADSWDAFPDKPPTDLGDIVKSGATGIAKGLVNIAGLPGDAAEYGARGIDRLTRLVGDVTGIDVNKREDRPPDYGSADITSFIEKNVGKFYEPKTTPGKYAETVGEFVPAALTGPGGMARKIATQAVIPGLAAEGASQATQGTPYQPYAKAAAGLAAGAGATMLARPGSASQAIRSQLPEGVGQADVDAARTLMLDAKNRGIGLTWPEALSQVTKRPVLTDTQRILESSPETRSKMQEFFADRPAQFDKAALDEMQNVAPGTANPSSIGRQASEAAQGTLTDVRKTINAHAEPFYQASEGVLLTPGEMAQVKKIPGFSEATQAVRDGPNAWRVQHLPDNSVGFLNAVKKHFDTAAENAGSKFNPAKNHETQATHEMQASAVKQIGEAMSPDYQAALAIGKQGRERFLQPLLDGPLGRIADKPDTRKAINALFPTNPLPNSHNEIATAVTALSKRNPWAATQLVRAHLESAFNEATRVLQGGPNQFGAAGFAKAVVGNPQQRENLRAAIESLPNGQKLWAGFDGFLEAAEATGTRQAKGSLTSFNTAERKMMEGSGAIGEAVKTGLSPGKWWSIVNDKWSKWKLGNNLNELASILTDPASGKILERIAAMPKGSREAGYLASRLILQADQSLSETRKPVR